MKKCKQCDKKIPKINIYCSGKCQHRWHYELRIKNWYSGEWSGTVGIRAYSLAQAVRRHLLEQEDYKCSLCGWNTVNPHTNKIPLEIDHIDGDYTNCRPDNLRVLCPNCHALQSTHKGANARKPENKYRYGDKRKNSRLRK